MSASVRTPPALAGLHVKLLMPQVMGGKVPAVLMVLARHDAGADQLCERLALSGYMVASVAQEQLALDAVLAELKRLPECNGRLALVGVGISAELPLTSLAAGSVASAVVYAPGGVLPSERAIDRCERGLLLHLLEGAGELPPTDNPLVESYRYPGVSAVGALPSLAFTRTLDVLRRSIGPRLDLAALWDNHCYVEFATRDVDATMSTMVAEPYVNSVPVLTGGVGHAELRRFYAKHFCDKNPTDTKITVISRTVTADRLIDEMVFSFTHDMVMDWMLPGIMPTGRYVEVPLVAIIQFQGDKLVHEHIYWDQASVLAQVGVLDPQTLPITGREQALKVRGEPVPANRLMGKLWDEDGYQVPSPR